MISKANCLGILTAMFVSLNHADAQSQFGWFGDKSGVPLEGVRLTEDLSKVYRSIDESATTVIVGGRPGASEWNRDYYGPEAIGRWCQNIQGILDRAHMRAVIASHRGYFEQSVNALVNGLKEALEEVRYGYYNRVLLARVIWRGVELAKTLARSSNSESDVRAVNIFLEKYYQFVSNVHQQVDRSYVIPYGNCYNCIESEILAFEGSIVDAAKSQLEIVLGGLAVNTGRLITPLGGPHGRMFLKGLQKSLIFSADTLLLSPYSNLYYCAIQRMGRLAHDIQNGMGYDVVTLTQWAYQEADDILQSLSVRPCISDGRGFSPSMPGNPGSIRNR